MFKSWPLPITQFGEVHSTSRLHELSIRLEAVISDQSTDPQYFQEGKGPFLPTVVPANCVQAASAKSAWLLAMELRSRIG